MTSLNRVRVFFRISEGDARNRYLAVMIKKNSIFVAIKRAKTRKPKKVSKIGSDTIQKKNSSKHCVNFSTKSVKRPCLKTRSQLSIWL